MNDKKMNYKLVKDRQFVTALEHLPNTNFDVVNIS